MRVLKIPSLTLLISMLAGCISIPGARNIIRGSGRVVSESRQASGFDEIHVCCGMRLILSEGESESLDIEAEDNLLPEIVSSVSGGRLTVRFKDNTAWIQYRPTEPILVKVSATDIHALNVSGGGRLEAGPLKTDRLEVDLSGGSRGEFTSVRADDITIDVSGGGRISGEDLTIARLRLDLSGSSRAEIAALQGDTLILNASGGGESTAAGKVSSQEISLSGGAGLRAGDLQSETATIRMSGGGRSTLWVTGSLDANLSGGAKVEYYGRPEITDDLSGGSKLEPLGEK